ncbi:MAG TPA: P-loop NTPase fold protein [Allosphingosinicella sp.]
MIYQKEQPGPATHALIIGATGYSAYPELVPPVASRSAAMFATWMRQRFRNPQAPLASLDWVCFDVFQIERAQQLTDGSIDFIPALNFGVLRHSIEEWIERLRLSPGSQGIFFFSGRAVRAQADTILLPPEFQPGSGGEAISLLGLLEGMAGVSSDLIFLIDAGRPEYSGPIQAWPQQEGIEPIPRKAGRAVIHATAPGAPAHVDRNGTSLFAKAMMESLEFAADRRVSQKLGPHRLLELIHQHLTREARDEGVEQWALGNIHGDFIIHEAPLEFTPPTDWRDLAVGPPMPGWPRAIPQPASADTGEQAESGTPTGLDAQDVASGAAVVTPAEAGPAESADRKPLSGPPAGGGDMPILDEGFLDGGPAEPPRRRARHESNTDFVPDDAETERDALGRSVLAIGLARRLHRIWRSANEPAVPGSWDERAAFVVHLDSPWGGGKTSFANFMARVLDPQPAGRKPAEFLRERYGDSDLGGIFLDDPPADEAERERLAKLPDDARRPWIVIPFNAWQVEHCAPPWWVFYQTIRKGCFDAVRKDGDLPWRPGEGRPRLPWLQRMDVAAKLWLAEIGWRLTNPKVRSLLLTALISLALLVALQRFGMWGLIAGKEPKTGFLLDSAFGLALSGLTTITFLWGLGALFTESIVPGTDTLAERLSLGSGDPFDRFRRHFARTIARVRRPVMVVVDDLDRCRPDFVVGLVRGIQTLLRSPRVVFVILGDRDWIERAFEAHHKAMEKVDVGPEQSFGARFVEKAIKMSFILPATEEETRRSYVRGVLLGPDADSKPKSTTPIDSETAKMVREVVRRETSALGADPFNSEAILGKALANVARRADGAPTEAADADRTEQIRQEVNDTMAINAAASPEVEQGVVHQLEPLAEHFPPNPRQIKRIVNAVTIYYAAALQRRDIEPDAEFRIQLALWVIIMTEWPQTWRLLAAFPSLVPILQSADPLGAVNAEGADLPGSAAATAKVVARIVADPDLMALIKGGTSAPLDPKLVPRLAQLTPLPSRKRRLTEEEAAAKDGDKIGGTQ